jgi:RNA recognition motif-containing protein
LLFGNRKIVLDYCINPNNEQIINEDLLEKNFIPLPENENKIKKNKNNSKEKEVKISFKELSKNDHLNGSNKKNNKKELKMKRNKETNENKKENKQEFNKETNKKEEKEKTLFVQNLAFDTTEDDLRNWFSYYYYNF